MITVTSARKGVGSRHLWVDVDLRVEDGEMVALTGPSGSGKSTLLNCLGLLEPLDSGRIEVDGETITGRSGRFTRTFRRDRLGYLFQNYALVDAATVRANLDIVLGTRARLGGRRRDDQAAALAAVGMAGRDDDDVFTLSGGEQQRVALARLILKQASVVLADEPTGALDEANAEMVMSALRSFADRGATVVVATHSDTVMAQCDRVVDVRQWAPSATPVTEEPRERLASRQ